MSDNKGNSIEKQRDVDQAFKDLRDHLRELERRQLIDTAETRWKRDRREERTNLRDPNDPANRN